MRSLSLYFCNFQALSYDTKFRSVPGFGKFMEMEEKNSGSTCERFLGAVRRSLVHSAQFLQMGVLLSNEETDVEGMVSLKKNSSSLLEREKPPLRELNLLKKKENFIYSHDNYFPRKFFYRPFHCILLLKWRFFSHVPSTRSQIPRINSSL